MEVPGDIVAKRTSATRTKVEVELEGTESGMAQRAFD